jgi:hypothetical protein
VGKMPRDVVDLVELRDFRRETGSRPRAHQRRHAYRGSFVDKIEGTNYKKEVVGNTLLVLGQCR